MIKHRNKLVLACEELQMQENGLKKFRTIVSEVSSFVGNHVLLHRLCVRNINENIPIQT